MISDTRTGYVYCRKFLQAPTATVLPQVAGYQLHEDPQVLVAIDDRHTVQLVTHQPGDTDNSRLVAVHIGQHPPGSEAERLQLRIWENARDSQRGNPDDHLRVPADLDWEHHVEGDEVTVPPERRSSAAAAGSWRSRVRPSGLGALGGCGSVASSA
jgi:hypothetical protein